MVQTQRSDNVEIAVYAGGTTFEFGNQYNISEAKKIVGIEAYGAAQLTKSPQQRSVVNDAAFKTAFLTLITISDNKETVKQYPLVSLCPALNNGMIREFDLGQINTAKCSISFGSSAAVVNNEVVYLVFHIAK